MSKNKDSNLILPFEKPKRHGYLEEESKQNDTEEIKKSRSLIIRAAHLHCAPGFGVTGFAVVYMYQLDGEDTHTYNFVCQSDFGEMKEGHADMAIKKLAEHSMVMFGRKVPERRQ